jgi:Secretion system C-terminal sorting domain
MRSKNVLFMKKIYFLLLFTFCIVGLQFYATAQCGANLLSNPSFETPVQPLIGNNLTGVFTLNGGWTMTGGSFNLVKTNGTAYGGGPDNAQNGTQYIDVTSAAGTVYQDFSISAPSTSVSFGGYFSSREQSAMYVNWTASIDIVSLPSLTVVASSNSRAFTNADAAVPAQETWYYINGNTTLAAGNYRYVINLGNYGNFDNAFVFENCVLPIKLQYFTAALYNKAVQLNWKVDAQSDVSLFEVQRSADGNTFETIGTVASSNANMYRFDDRNPINGIGYYRLKATDNTGLAIYSSTIKVAAGGKLSLQLAPNPVIDFVSISGLSGKGTISIFTIEGKKVTDFIVKGNTVAYNLQQLKAGIYIIQYFDKGNTQTLKLIKK